MKEKRKLICAIILVIIIIVVVSTGTYAFYKWRSSSSIDVTVDFDNTADTLVTFNGGSSITGSIVPTLSASDGRIKEMNISTNIAGYDTFSLYLKINTLPNVLKVDYFKWQLTSCDMRINSSCASTASINVGGNFTTTSMSNFYDSTTGDLLLLENQTIPNNLDLYLYLWIDGNVDNDLSIGNLDIDFDVYATGTSLGSFQDGS